MPRGFSLVTLATETFVWQVAHDGFWVFEDPSDHDYVYAEYQGGHIGRINRKTLETKEIEPFPAVGEKKLRNNWNSPIHISQINKGTIYFGSQFLFRSRDHGDSWERISPDLTTNDPAKQKQDESGGLAVDNSDAEAHTTIYTISESTKNGNTVWVGTDDGKLQVTRNGGKIGRTSSQTSQGCPRTHGFRQSKRAATMKQPLTRLSIIIRRAT